MSAAWPRTGATAIGLYVVTHCASAPTLQDPISDPARFPWHEVTKVAHYYLSVNTLKHPVEIRETGCGYDAEATL